MNSRTNKLLIGVTILIFAVFVAFWAVIAAKGLQGNTSTAELFSALYGIMALFGGLIGIVVSRKWGGFKSLIGRAIGLISLGLLAQEAGQIIYSMYTYLFHQEIPYPSWGDVGFFGSVILYIFASLTLVKALSTKARRSGKNRIWAVLLPALLLVGSYYVFLRGYQFDSSKPLTTFLDFGYPLGQAFYLALGLLALVLSFRYLGGVMRSVILFLLFALALQYASDFTFLYQVSRDTWKTAGFNELMYLVSYFVMTLSLIKFSTVFAKLSAPKGVKE